MPRQSALDNFPGLRDFIAVQWHEGRNNQAIAEAIAEEWPALDPSARTIVRWRQDEEIKQKVAVMQRDRVTRIVRRVDAQIMQRLDERAEELDIDELIKIRKALVPNVDAFTDEKQDKKGILESLFSKAHDDPDFAKSLQNAFEAQQDSG